MIGPNLSKWALSKRSLVIFLMILSVAAGALSFVNLGRNEDPAFTFRTMVVGAAWPGATVEETMEQVPERLARTLPEADFLDRIRSDFAVEMSDKSSVVVSQATLPREPKVLVLPGR